MNNIFKIIMIIIVATLFSSCSSNRSLYNSDFPFSNKLAYPSDSSFSVLIPQGWYQIEDNECDCNNVLLVQNNFRTTLNLIPVAMDNVSTGRIEKDPLKKLLKYSRIKNEQKYGGSLNTTDQESFEVNNVPVKSYSYISNSGNMQRVLVFLINGKFFELTGNSVTKDKYILKDLFSAQNSLVGKINYLSVQK